jgi:hypothetical protein
MTMESRKEKYTSWETIKKEHPNRFVLLENPVFNPLPHLKEAILLYKHKSRKRVIEKELELKPHIATIVYTGGIRGDKVENEYLFVL